MKNEHREEQVQPIERLLHITKILVKSIWAGGSTAILMFGILPLILAFVYSFIYGNAFGSKAVVPVIQLHIVDEDQSDFSAMFIKIFDNKQFELTNEDPDYILTIPNGYEAMLLNQQPVTVDITESKNVSSLAETFLIATIDQYSDILSETLIVMNSQSIEEKEIFIEHLNLLRQQSSLSIENIAGDDELLSDFEKQVSMVSGFAFFMILYSLGTSTYMQQNTGLYQRCHTFPISKANMLNLDIYESFIYSAINITLSIILFSFFGRSIREHFLYFIPVILMQAIIIGVFSQVITQLLPKMIGNGVMMIFMMVEVIGSSINGVVDITQYSPGRLLHQLYENAMLGQWNGFGLIFLISGAACLIGYFALRVKIKVKWGNQ